MLWDPKRTEKEKKSKKIWCGRLVFRLMPPPPRPGARQCRLSLGQAKREFPKSMKTWPRLEAALWWFLSLAMADTRRHYRGRFHLVRV
jgi:hypothetical protein